MAARAAGHGIALSVGRSCRPAHRRGPGSRRGPQPQVPGDGERSRRSNSALPTPETFQAPVSPKSRIPVGMPRALTTLQQLDSETSNAPAPGPEALFLRIRPGRSRRPLPPHSSRSFRATRRGSLADRPCDHKTGRPAAPVSRQHPDLCACPSGPLVSTERSQDQSTLAMPASGR
jgi:hypothetical protein